MTTYKAEKNLLDLKQGNIQEATLYGTVVKSV